MFRAGLLSELLSRRQAPHGATQELVRTELITTTCGGGPEGIRTPDLLNAICRAGVHEGPLGSAPVFDSVRHRPPSSTAIALRPPRAAVKCAVNLSARDLPDLARHVTVVFDELPSPAPALRGPRAALPRRGAR